MLCAVRAQLYRMFRGRAIRVLLAVIFVPTACSAVLSAVVLGSEGLTAFLSSTSSDLSRVAEAAAGRTPVLSLYGSSFVNGSFVAMVACGYTAAHAAREVGGGKRGCCAKNLLQSPGGRVSYVLAHVAAAAVAGAVFVAAGVASTALCYGLAGFPVVPESAAQAALWVLEVWAVVFAYQLLTLAVTFASRNEAASVVFGLFLGGFAVGKGFAMLVGALVAAFGPVPVLAGAWDFLERGSLMAHLQTLGHGEACGPEALVVAGVTLFAASALAVLVMRRKNVE